MTMSTTCAGGLARSPNSYALAFSNIGMLNNPEAHLMIQKGRQVSDLSNTPESMRADRFLTEHVEQARQRANRATRLKKTDDEAKAKINKASKRLERFEDALSNLHESMGPTEFAGEARVRPSRRNRGPIGLEGRIHE